MGLMTTARIDEEVDVEVDDEDVIAYILGDPELMDRIAKERDFSPYHWAAAFADADSIAREQMISDIRRLCPCLNIEWKKA